MAEYKPGEMDVTAHQETYEIFWNWSVRIAVLCTVIIVAALAIFA